jgi:hypothetical protein
MLYAHDEHGNRVQPTATGQRAACPLCLTPVCGKCGELKQWHWAHEKWTGCDIGKEPETDWHRNWKRCFPPECQEVLRGPHRADAVTRSGWVIEFQHSGISIDEIWKREAHYQRMCWVVDGGEFLPNLDLRPKEDLTLRNDQWTQRCTFRWKWPRKEWALARCPVFLDLRDGRLFRIEWMSKDVPCGGKGTALLAVNFMHRAGYSDPDTLEDTLETNHQPFQGYCAECNCNGAREYRYEACKWCGDKLPPLH